MNDIEIIDFYNGGAQVTRTSPGTNMTHSFSADGNGEVVEVGYEPKANSKKVSGPSHDVVSIDGVDHLMLKKGYTYSVTLVTEDGHSDINEVIGAPEDHVSLPLPKTVVDVEVEEYTAPDKTPADTEE